MITMPRQPHDIKGGGEERREGLPSNESVAHCGKNPKNLSGEIQTTTNGELECNQNVFQQNVNMYSFYMYVVVQLLLLSQNMD